MWSVILNLLILTCQPTTSPSYFSFENSKNNNNNNWNLGSVIKSLFSYENKFYTVRW